VSEQLERILTEAIQTRRPVLVNPSEEEIRRAAEDLRRSGRLICTACRKPIGSEAFVSRRIAFGPRLEAVAHLHAECEAEFASAMAEGAEENPVP